MRQTTHRLIAVLLLVTLMAFHSMLLAKTEDIKEVTLENGLKVLIKEIRTSPIVAFTVWYQVGSKNERTGITGISHVCEHMMFKGTPTMSRDQMMEMVQGNGGTFNAGTANDMTVYFEIMPKNKLDIAMRIESDRMANSKMAKEDFESEIIVIQNERRQTLEDQPTGLWDEEVSAVAHLASPYHWSVVGWMTDLQTMTYEDVHNYYKTFYTPNNAFIVIAGDIDAAEAIDMVKQYFGAIPRGPEVPPVKTAEPAQNSTRIVESYSEKTNLPVLTYRYHIPEFGCGEHAELIVLSQILSSGRTSRLEKALVEARLASSASGFAELSKLPNLFSFSVNVMPGVELSAAENALNEEIRKVVEEPVTDLELEKAKNRTLASTIYDQEGTMNQAFTIGQYQLYKSYNYVDEELEAIQKVTKEGLLAVAKKYFRPNNLTIGRLFPAKSEAAAGHSSNSQRTTFYGMTEPEHQLESMFGDMNFYFPPAESGQSVGDIKINPLAPRIKEKKLSNGITLVVLENKILPIVSISGSITAGGVYDPWDKMGLSSLTANTMRRGTATRSYDQINETLEFVNASVEIGAGMENASFMAHCLKKDIDVTVSILADMLQKPSFPQDGFEIEKQQAVASAKQRMKNARSVADVAFRKIMYPNHPYSKESAGNETTLANLSLDDCKTFWANYYRPEQTTIVLVGDINLSEAEKLIKAKFGNWKAGTKSPELAIPPVPPLEGSHRSVVSMMEKAQGDVFYGFPGVTYSNPDYVPLQVLNYIFGGSTLSSRLGRNLRVQHGWTYGATSGFRSFKNGGHWVASVRTAKATIDSCIINTDYELNRLFTEKPTDEELTLAKNYLIGSTFRSVDTNSQIAGQVLDMKVNGLGYDYLDSYPGKINSVTKESLDRLMNTYFNFKKANATVIAGPVEK
ncbi:MAG: M16 family metallopeptidase [Candidatus Zhuqueibacterota bacterium]